MSENQNEEQVAPVTPIYDAVADQSETPAPVSAGPEFDGFHDEEDVDAALGRTTVDGPGFGDESQLPDEDFDGYATDDVEEK